MYIWISQSSFVAFLDLSWIHVSYKIYDCSKASIGNVLDGIDFLQSGLKVQNKFYVRKSVIDLWQYLSEDKCDIQLITGPPGA